jgi:hypothetical protein
MNEHAKPPFPKQKQSMPGKTDAMEPVPDHGEKSYRGSGRLAGKKAIITGADSGIGRAVAIAYAREGADVLIAYLNEHDDAKQTERLVKDAGRKAVLIAGDIQQANHCHTIVKTALAELGGMILVNNAAHQASFTSIEDISDEEWAARHLLLSHAGFALAGGVPSGPGAIWFLFHPPDYTLLNGADSLKALDLDRPIREADVND